MSDAVQDILTRWDRVTNRLVFLEKRFVFRHGGLELHPSEIHLLLAIMNEPDANATRLAERLGVTKGAVSQVLKRLEAKGVVVKHSDPKQKNEVTVTFTRSGRTALTAFCGERKATHQRFQAYLSTLSDGEKKTLSRFLDEVNSFLPAGE